MPDLSRAALALALVSLGWVPIARAQGEAVNPHVDPSLLTRSCMSCHRGHGISRSPMLPMPQKMVCMACHGTLSDRDSQIAQGKLASHARPQLLGTVMAQPYLHPVDDDARSRHDPRSVTCTSCHSPHRSSQALQPGGDPGIPLPRISTLDPNLLEFELCESCHGSAGATTQDLGDISRLLNPNNQSYHPVEAPATESSPSVKPELAQGQINCTDCHGNSDPSGPSGVHGSSVPFILRANYTTVDGAGESLETYALCWGCHDRGTVLEGSRFPDHNKHVVEERASCATCHNAHGSVSNRALIRFGEETLISGVSPSPSTGTLAFVSDGPGSGACYLSCHGVDHGPEAYGAMELRLEMFGRELGPGLQAPVQRSGVRDQ